MGSSQDARPPLPRWTMPVVVGGIVLVTGLVMTGLWWWVSRQPWTDAEKRTAALLDVVKVASGIALGGGGLFTLYLAARRQRTQELELAQREQAQADTNADAEARRVTELYTKAVQQLGDTKAPVRLGGLYALERLGQQQPDQRRTIINVLCAYLRMPYNSPSGSEGGVSRPLQRNSHRRVGIRPPDGPRAATLVEAHLERDVRLTAQRILTAHLRVESDEVDGEDYWGEHEIDLTGAVLVDFDMSKCRLGQATFDGATFVGEAHFFTEFVGPASFTGATFTHVSFDGASFADGVSFHEATFRGVTQFQWVAFSESTYFDGAVFEVDVWFNESSFDSVTFDWAFFADGSFAETEFEGFTTFEEVSFGDETGAGDLRLDEAWVQLNADTEDSVWPEGWQSGSTPMKRKGRSGKWVHLTQDE